MFLGKKPLTRNLTATELTTLTPLAIIIKLFNLRMFQTIRGLVHAGRFF